MLNPRDVFENPQEHWTYITAPDDNDFEGQHFDRKQAGSCDSNGRPTISKAQFDQLKQELVETVSAFANLHTVGGLLVIGVSSAGDPAGIGHLSEEQKNTICNMNSLLVHHAAQARLYEHTLPAGQKSLICLIFSNATQTGICETPGKFPKAWIRLGVQNAVLDHSKREQLRRDKRLVNFELMPCCRYEPEDVDQDVFTEFKRSLIDQSEFKDWTQERLLYQAGAIIRDGQKYQFTNAGFLFFAANPQRVITHSYCRLLRFECLHNEKNTLGSAVHDRTFSGPVTKQIRQLRSFFKESAFFKNIQLRKPDGGFREETEFPMIAVDEAIVNAIAHRDYAVQFPIELFGYRDAFVVNNSGTILQRENDVPREFTLSDVDLVSTPRNSKLIDWLRLMRDEHGAEFVRALSEGTRRMRDEMQRNELPPPTFKVTEWQTRLILLNNWEERSRLLRAPESQKVEIANLFPIKVSTVSGGTPRTIDPGMLRREFSAALQDSLQANGWFIDTLRFNRVVAHRKGVDLPILQQARQIVRFYRGYTFQLREYAKQLFLTIDYTLQVRSVLPARRLLNDQTFTDLKGRNAIAEYQGWHQCRIISSDVEFTRIYIFEFQSEQNVPSDRVIPALTKREIRELLKKENIRFDVDKQIKEYSLLLDTQASRKRREFIEQTASDVAENIFPLRVNQLRLSLDPSPLSLSRSANDPACLTIKSIQEPKVEFHQKHASSDVRDGITRFGAYDSDEHEIEIVPVCLANYRTSFASLIERLKTGKYKYRGAERTFSTRFHYASIITCESEDQLEPECARLLQEHHDWIGNDKLNRIFLIQTPEATYSLDDENAPYYRIKRLLLENGVPCQMVDDGTIQNPDWKDLNLALNLIAKCGVRPWVLPGAIPDADFFVGLSYTENRHKGTGKLLGHANVFNNYGRWLFFSGNTQTVPFEERTAHFQQLVRSTLLRLTLSATPSVYFHSSVKFSRDDKQAILSAARSVHPGGTYYFVWINAHHSLRFFDIRPEGDGSLSRGSYVITAPNQIYLSTTGNNPFRKLLGTPVLLEINATVYAPDKQQQRTIDLHALAAQILSLTKLNWASTDSLCGEPITTKYAGDIAYLTAAFLRQTQTFNLHPVLERTPWFI